MFAAFDWPVKCNIDTFVIRTTTLQYCQMLLIWKLICHRSFTKIGIELKKNRSGPVIINNKQR